MPLVSMKPQGITSGRKTDWHNCMPLCVVDYCEGPGASRGPWRGYLMETLHSDQGSSAHEARAKAHC